MTTTPPHRAVVLILTVVLLGPTLLVTPPALAADAPGGTRAQGTDPSHPAAPFLQPTTARALQPPTTVTPTLLGALLAADVDAGDPIPLPEPQGPRPLATALGELAAVRDDVDPRELDRVQDQADLLPMDLQIALARIVLATAESTRVSQASGAGGVADPGETARGALLMTRAVDASLPTLQRYRALVESGARDITLDQARTMDEVVALALGGVPEDASRSPTLPDAILRLHRVLGVETAPGDGELLRAGAAALPDDVAQATAVMIARQATAADLRVEALAGLTPRDLALLHDPAAIQAVQTGTASDATTLALLDAASKVDHRKLAQANLLVVTAALQAQSILQEDAPEPEPVGPLQAVWERIKAFVNRLLPVGTAIAQEELPGTACPRESPLHDCDNDVWFRDPYGVVVVSGYGSTVYDDRYGKLSFTERGSLTLRRLPTDDVAVDPPGIVPVSGDVEGSEPRERFENSSRNADLDDTADLLDQPYYALTLDLGGDDTYINQTASNGEVIQFLTSLGRDNTTWEDLNDRSPVFLPNPLGSSQPIPHPPPEEPLAVVPLLQNVLVDLGGDDAYTPAPHAAERPQFQIAVGFLGGLGLVLDAQGNDTYVAGNGSIAVGAVFGTGVLLDLDGSDRYEAGNFSISAAQFFGTSLVLDTCRPTISEGCEAGDDVYRTGAFSQGASAVGTAAFLDRGGNDLYHVRWASLEPNGPRFYASQGQSFQGLAAFADLGGAEDTGIRPHEQDTPGLSNLLVHRYNASAEPNEGQAGARVWTNASSLGLGVALDLTRTPDPEAFLQPRSGMIARAGELTLPGMDLPGVFALDLVSNSLYEEDYLVLVDVGGDDTYRNNAGASLPTVTRGTVSARINSVDLSEDRRGAASALLLDLGGSDLYDARDRNTTGPLAPWGVQGAGDAAPGILVDLGESSDRYVARDNAQGAARRGGVGLLLDDGSGLDGPDTFDGGNLTQGAAVWRGLAVLADLRGTTFYDAGDFSQGYGEAAGIDQEQRDLRDDAHGSQTGGAGILVDGSSPDASGDDTYRAGNQAQGVGQNHGLGLLLDQGGDDIYLAQDRSQGYAAVKPAPATLLRNQPDRFNETRASQGYLLDLQGTDRYETQGNRVHGYADLVPFESAISGVSSGGGEGGGGGGGDGNTDGGDDGSSDRTPSVDATKNESHLRTLAYLLDFALPASEELDPNELETTLREYDAWLREGRGDTYSPATTAFGGAKAENAYWEQPPSSNLTGPNPLRVGLGMDNPPISGLAAGADRTFGALWFLNDTVPSSVGAPNLALLLQREARPTVELEVCGVDSDDPRHDACTTVHAPSGSTLQAVEADGDDQPIEIHATVGYPLTSFLYGPGDPDGRTEVDFYLRHVNWSTARYLGTERVPIVDRPDAECQALISAPLVCPDARTTITLELANTTELVDDPRDPDRRLRLYPDGDYEVHVVARNLGTLLTGGRITTSGDVNFTLGNPPALLGLDVLHPNPDRKSAGSAFTFLTSGPDLTRARVNITPDGVGLDDTHVWADDPTGLPSTCERDGAQRICRTTVTWSGHWDHDDAFLAPGAYRFTAEARPDTAERRLKGFVVSDAEAPEGGVDVPTGYVGLQHVIPGSTRVVDGTPRYDLAIPLNGTDAGSGVRSFHVTVSDPNLLCPDHGTASDLVIEAYRLEKTEDVYLAELRLCDLAHGDRLRVDVRAVDRAGNRGPRDRTVLQVDTKPPTSELEVAPYLSAPGYQNQLVFPVGFANLSEDTQVIYGQFAIIDPTTGKVGPWRPFANATVGSEALERGWFTWNATRANATDDVGDGTRLLLRVLARDHAGNLQKEATAPTVPVTLDLVPPEFTDLEVTAGLDRIEVRWELSEPGIRHQLTVHHPNGTEEVRWKNGTVSLVAFDVPGLQPNTTFAFEAASQDKGGTWVESSTRRVATTRSLVASFTDPSPSAILRGLVPLNWTAGAVPSDEGGDPSTTLTITVQALLPDGSTVNRTLIEGVDHFVRHAPDSPGEPVTEWYPPTWDTTKIPDAGAVTLELTLANDLEAVTTRRTVMVDNTPPETPDAAVDLGGERGNSVGDVPWFLGPVAVEAVHTSDALSGVEATYVGLDGANVTTLFDPEDPPEASSEGLHVLRFRSVDRAGNEEPQVNQLRFGIDTLPPTADVQVAGGAVVTDRNITLQIVASDPEPGSGAAMLRIAESVAGLEERSWTPYEPDRVRYPWTLSDGDGPKRLYIEVMDHAGNSGRSGVQVDLQREPPDLVGAVEVEHVDHTEAVLVYRTSKDARTLVEVGLNDSFDRTVEAEGLHRDHRVVLPDLLPGRTYLARVVLEDALGNRGLSDPIPLTTPVDERPPSGVGAVQVTDLGNGQLQVNWSEAGDDVGIRDYEILRARGEANLTPLDSTPTPRYRDTDVEPGVPYTYAVRAVDLGGNRGPTSATVTGTPTTPPVLADARVDPPVGDEGTPFTFTVVVSDADGDVPARVQVIVDGTPHTLQPVVPDGDIREGIRYNVTLTLDETSLTSGAHTYRFEASDGTRATAWPAVGEEKGPVVRAGLQADAAGLVSGLQERLVPAPAALLVVLLVAAVAALAPRRSRR